MRKTCKFLLSIMLIFFMTFSGLPVNSLNSVAATANLPIQLGINGSTQTTGYDTIGDAVKAIEAQLKSNVSNKNNTYEIYLAEKPFTQVGTDYTLPEGDFTFPDVKRITLCGNVTDLEPGSDYFTISSVGFSGNLQFLSDVEIKNLNFVNTTTKLLEIKGSNIYNSGHNRYGSYSTFHPNPDNPAELLFTPNTNIRIQCDRFYSTSFQAAQQIESGKYSDVNQLVSALSDFNEYEIVPVLELASACLDTDTFVAVGYTTFRGVGSTSHITNHQAISLETNEWQSSYFNFSISGYVVEKNNETSYYNDISVTVDNVLLKYQKAKDVAMPTASCISHSGTISIGNISLDTATSSISGVRMVASPYSENGIVGNLPNLRITGQMHGISEIHYGFSTLYDTTYYNDWREYFNNADGSRKFPCIFIEQEQDETITMSAGFSCPDNGLPCKLQKNGQEYYIDFNAPLMEIFDSSADGYIQVGDFLYSIPDGYLNGAFFESNPYSNGVAFPIYYTGSSPSMEFPESFTYDGHTYDVIVYYAVRSLNANVEKIHLPSFFANPLTNLALNQVNNLLAGGGKESRFNSITVAEDHPMFSTDDAGNLYSQNGSVLYCVPSAKTTYTFPESVTKIAATAFTNSKIRNLVIPDSVQIIEDFFTGMEHLEKLVFTGTDPIDFRYYTDSAHNSLFVGCGNPGTIIYGAESTGAANEAKKAGFLYEPDATIYGTANDFPYEVLGTLTIGDTDREDGISATDALIILKVVANMQTCTPLIRKTGDTDFSGKISAEDALMVLKQVAHLIYDFEENVSGGSQVCKTNGHNYNTVTAATYDTLGIKQCSYCKAEHPIQKKNPAYKVSTIESKPTVSTTGYKYIYDLDTGEIIESIVLEPLMGGVSPENVWILGDSIAACHEKDGYERPLYGWGELIGNYYTEKISFQNKAKSSQSSKSYTTTSEYKSAFGNNNSGIGISDYVIISFGHNDHNTTGGNSRLTDPDAGSDVEGSFKWYLKNYYIDPVLERAAVPFLMSPVSRCFYDSEGNFAEEAVHLKYAKAMKELVAEYEDQGITIYYIDTQEYTYQLYSSLTKDEAMKYHGLGQPSWGEWYEDTTHYSKEGAEMITEYIVNSLKKLPLGLNNYLKTE